MLAKIYLNLLRGKLDPMDVRKTLQQIRRQNQGSGEAEKREVLNHAYRQAMERISGQTPNFRHLAFRALGWIVFASRPLSPSELQHALYPGLEDEDGRFEAARLLRIERILSVCVGLVTVDKASNVIRLAHYTTQEFFQEYWMEWFPDAKKDVAKTCIKYLSLNCFEGVYGGTPREYLMRLREFPLYLYAVLNLGLHGAAADMDSEIIDFLDHRFDNALAAFEAATSMDIRWTCGANRPPLGVTKMHIAAMLGLDNAVRTLMGRDDDLSPRDSTGLTPLLYAVNMRHIGIAQLLIEGGAETDAQGRSTGTIALFNAVERNLPSIVSLLLEKGADVRASGSNHRSLLHQAAYCAKDDVVKICLERGIDIDSRCEGDQTPLHLAIAGGSRCSSTVKVLLENGANVELRNPHGQTALHLAASTGNFANTAALLQCGAAIDAEDAYGRTPLFEAATSPKLRAAILLLVHGANTESRDNDGLTPLLFAATEEANGGHVINSLLRHGADITATSHDGLTPLMMAVQCGQPREIVELLIEKGADVNVKTDAGQSALSIAVANETPALLGHCPDGPDDGRESNRQVIELLLERGSDIEARDSDGRTSLELALDKGNKDAAEILLRKYLIVQRAGAEGLSQKLLGLSEQPARHPRERRDSAMIQRPRRRNTNPEC